MATISRIRLGNIIYDNGKKRYNDNLFVFDSEHSIILLPNGFGKTVLLQLMIQAILPHQDVANRKIKDTLLLSSDPANIAIEWVISENPKVYALTVVSLYLDNNVLKSLKYVYEYGEGDVQGIEQLPFSVKNSEGELRPANRHELSDYYKDMQQKKMQASTFESISAYCKYLEEHFHISSDQWKKIAFINAREGGVDSFFHRNKGAGDREITSKQLLNELIIPTISDMILANSEIDFADTFEKQREHFAKNKKARNELANMKMISKELDSYSEHYKHHYDKVMEYIGVYLDLESLRNEVETLKESQEADYKQNESYLEQMNEELKEIDYHFRCIEIKEVEEKICQMEEECSSKKEITNRLQIKCDHLAKEIQNIEISELRANMKRLEDENTLLQENLTKLDEEFSLSQVVEALDDVKSKIRGYYENELEILKGKLAKLQRDKKGEDEKKTQIVSQIEREQKNIEKSNIQVGVYKDSIEKIKARINSIFMALGCVEFEIQTKKTSSERKIRELTAEEQENILTQEEDEKKIASMESNLNDLHKKTADLAADESSLKEKLKKITSSGNLLISKILEKYPKFRLNQVDDLYLESLKLSEHLHTQCESLRSRYEKALEDYHLGSKQHLEYKDSNYYTADIILERWMRKLSNQYSSLNVGSNYVEILAQEYDMSIDFLYECYPFWAITLVVEKFEYDKIKEFLSAHKEEINHQVILLSTSDVKEMLDGARKGADVADEYIIFPSLWKENLYQEAFLKWKEGLAQKSQSYQEISQQLAREYDMVNRLKNELSLFFQENPFEEYSNIKRELSTVQMQIPEHERKINLLQQEKSKLELHKKDLQKRIAHISDEKKSLERTIEQCNEYFKNQKELEQYYAQSEHLEASLHIFQRTLQNLTRDLSISKEELEKLNLDIVSINYSISKIVENELYIECKSSPISYCDMTIEALKLQKNDLQDQLKGISADRNLLQMRIDANNEQLHRDSDKLDWQIKTAKFEIEILEHFDKNSILELKLEHTKIEKELAVHLKEEQNLEQKIAIQKGIKEEKIQELSKQGYSQVVVFQDPLGVVKIKLQNRQSLLRQNLKETKEIQAKLSIEKEENSEQLDILKDAKANFDKNLKKTEDYKKKEEQYRLNSSENKFLIDYTYNKTLVVKNMVDKLKNAVRSFEKSAANLQYHFDSYKSFCQRNIENINHRSNFINGISNVGGYDEFLTVKQNLKNSIERNMEMIQIGIQESEKEIQALMKMILGFCKSLLLNISEIGKKTGIKTKSGIKYFYDFMVPEFDMELAKRNIQLYMDAMVEKYDRLKEQSEELLGEETFESIGGSESLDLGEIHRKVSTSKRLLTNEFNASVLIWKAIGDQVIRVRCRKVEKDSEISDHFFEWEISGQWSGGEKWSKNMALFLAILNYVEEKKFVSENNTSRVVVLDNPFGAASSTHVLDPVFYIAKKLGYQIIALTAHEGGKFISDFFPIVYSGKAQSAYDGSRQTQILDYDLTVNTAFMHQKDF